MLVREIMTKQTAFCGLDTSLAAAVETMRQRGCGFLPVVGEGGNVVGVITDRDISIALGTRGKKPSELLVQDVMLPHDRTFPRLFACTPDEDVHCALKTMRKQRVRRLPVVDREGALLGVLSLDDVALRSCRHPGKHDISCQEVIQTYQAICGRRGGKRSPAAA
jgi:CBS domain-containing protein